MNGFNRSEDIPDDMMDFVYRRDEILVGRYRVIYGYRLRAGYEGEPTFDLDICCGASLSNFLEMLEKVTAIIDYNISKKLSPFNGIPKFSKVKPYPNDMEFCNRIGSLYNIVKGYNNGI